MSFIVTGSLFSGGEAVAILRVSSYRRDICSCRGYWVYIVCVYRAMLAASMLRASWLIGEGLSIYSKLRR